INETAAENVSCELYGSSLMRCTWNYGRNAPKDINYTVLMRQEQHEKECENYQNDRTRKTGKCEFRDLNVESHESICILVEGSDDVQLSVKWFNPLKIDILQPPKDISVVNLEHDVILHWTKPDTFYTASNTCFQYIIQDMKRNKEYYANGGNNTYKVPVPSKNEECTLRMRAKGTLACDMNTNWGEWSEEIQCGKN
ncbi:hypothetical protein GDO86_003015, partial [Hymenochirus boettgeri]